MVTVCSGSVKARCRRLGAAAVTQGGGSSAGDGDSGSGTAEERLCRLGKTRARLLEKQGSAGGGNEMNLKSQPPPPLLLLLFL